MEMLTSFKDPHVRALAWSIGGPSMIAATADLPTVSTSTFSTYLDHATPWLQQLDEDPSPLHGFLEEASCWKVGLHFEAMVDFWLQHGSHYTLVARNLQVQEEKRTLGAFDFIIRNERGQAEHWEIAVKFYLQRGDGTQREHWVGPNKRDRLDLKLDRMAGHQLPLSKTKPGRAALASIGIPEAPTPRAWVKGMLFRPFHEETHTVPGAERGEPRGVWVEGGHFETYAKAFPESRWLLRERPDWLSLARNRENELMNADEATARAQRDTLTLPEMWSRLNQRDHEIWTEEERLFVIPDRWLDVEEPGAI